MGFGEVPERFTVYRYEIRRPDDDGPETRWSLVPVRPYGYAGDDEPSEAHPMGGEQAEVGQPRPAGEVEAPDGSRIASMDPPILEIPGRGQVALLAIMGEGEGGAGPLAREVRFRAY
jgi:hypothetical protein